MKKHILIALLSVFALSFTFAQDWKKYKAEDLAILAYFPGEPERSVQEVPTAVGKLDMHMIMYTPTSNDKNMIYSAIRSDYPESQFENVDSSYNDTILDGAVNGAVSNVNGTLKSDEKITFNGYPGRSIKISAQGMFLYINAYLVDSTMFITQVICSPANDGNSDIDKFLNSFDILKVK